MEIKFIKKMSKEKQNAILLAFARARGRMGILPLYNLRRRGRTHVSVELGRSDRATDRDGYLRIFRGYI